MRRIAVVNMKGGVGKTTTAVQIASGFAARGARVLLVDTDPQGNVGHLLGVTSPLTILDLMMGTAPINDVIRRQARTNLDVITATPAAFSLESQLAGTVQRETLLERRMRGVTGVDLVVFDTSPAMSLLTYNALLCANELVVPVGMDTMALAGARQTLDGVNEIRSLWPARPGADRRQLPDPRQPRDHRGAGGRSRDGAGAVLARHPPVHRPDLRGGRAPDDLGIRAGEPGGRRLRRPARPVRRKRGRS
jgi:cellulose biosynthesis protein BcsQ